MGLRRGGTGNVLEGGYVREVLLTFHECGCFFEAAPAGKEEEEDDEEVPVGGEEEDKEELPAGGEDEE